MALTDSDHKNIMNALQTWIEFYGKEPPFEITKDPIGDRNLYECDLEDMEDAAITFRKEFLDLIEANTKRRLKNEDISELGYGIYFMSKMLQSGIIK